MVEAMKSEVVTIIRMLIFYVQSVGALPKIKDDPLSIIYVSHKLGQFEISIKRIK